MECLRNFELVQAVNTNRKEPLRRRGIYKLKTEQMSNSKDGSTKIRHISKSHINVNKVITTNNNDEL